MPVGIGTTMPDTSGTEVAAASFSEAKVYFRAEAQGWHTAPMFLPAFTSCSLLPASVGHICSICWTMHFISIFFKKMQGIPISITPKAEAVA